MRAVLGAALLTAAVSAQTPPAAIPAPADLTAPPADAVKTKSGLITKVLMAGTSKDRPTMDDVVTVHYTAWTSDGKMFETTRTRGTPTTAGIWRMLPGLTEGIRLMVPGEKRRMWIPESLAYKGHDPRGTLVFDVEFIEMPLRPPPDVKAAPADATRTASGLAYRILRPGTGRHPGPGSQVTVNYTGWTTDGEMFESSFTKGAPMTVAVAKVIAGWKEGLPLMAEGGRMRFWVPEKLAYRGVDPPYGLLVFDIDLIKITP